MIAILNYGLGNLASIANSLDKLSIPYQITDDPRIIQQSAGLILPGVGAAGQGIKNIKAKNLDKLLVDQISIQKPILGICLGMQLLFTFSEEGNVDCLNIVKGKVKKFETNLKIPQIGWNQVNIRKQSRLLRRIKDGSFFYFVHSFYCKPADERNVVGITDYGQSFCSVLEMKNIFGVQFHPEKSGEIGMKLLKNFGDIL